MPIVINRHKRGSHRRRRCGLPRYFSAPTQGQHFSEFLHRNETITGRVQVNYGRSLKPLPARVKLQIAAGVRAHPLNHSPNPYRHASMSPDAILLRRRRRHRVSSLPRPGNEYILTFRPIPLTRIVLIYIYIYILVSVYII